MAAVAALLTLPVGAVIKRRILTNRDLEAGREVARRAEQMEAAAEAAARLATTARSDEVAGPEGAQGDGEAAEARKAASKAAQSSSDARVEAARAEEEVAAIHANAEVFDPRTEDVFRYLQIFTACCDSFGHGANDVANAVGPLAAIVVIYQTGEVSTKVDTGATGYYILLLGGVGIALGLLLYGYKIMAALGVKIAKITPARERVAETALHPPWPPHLATAAPPLQSPPHPPAASLPSRAASRSSSAQRSSSSSAPAWGGPSRPHTARSSRRC